MSPTDKVKFGELMQGIGEYYGKQVTPMLIQIYWNGLHGYTFEDVTSAINAHVRNPDSGQFMPKIADVERHLHGNTGTRAMAAWVKVSQAIQEVGTYMTVKFDDQLIHAVINDMGGWPAIGQITNDDLPFRIREFEKRYQAYLQIPPARTPEPVLLGVFERTNRVLGFNDSKEPVLIGRDGGKSLQEQPKALM